MAYSYNGILHGNKKERTNYCTSNNMNESQRQTEWKKPDQQSTSCITPLMWSSWIERLSMVEKKLQWWLPMGVYGQRLDGKGQEGLSGGNENILYWQGFGFNICQNLANIIPRMYAFQYMCNLP